MAKERYVELLAGLTRTEELFALRGLWTSRLNAKILRAIAHMKLGNQEQSLTALKSAYDMAYDNGIITPFIELPRHMRTLINHAKSSEIDFDPDWLESISQKAQTYGKRMGVMQHEYARKHKGVVAQTAGLSKREATVLHNLSQGLTREEIADSIGVSVNTVKSIIRNIYNKLGAINRADAIRLAVAKGILLKE